MVKVLHREGLEPKAGVILGTRPGIIKLSPVIRELRAREVPFVIIHTGQHYSPELDAVFSATCDCRRLTSSFPP
jgi:UDP-N-acetylglucosamine 2-epimerase